MKFDRFVLRDENNTGNATRVRATTPPRRRTGPAPAAPFEPLERRALLSAGQLDPAFGGGDGVASHPDAGVDVWPEALAVAADGKLVAVGNDDTAANSFDFVVARFNADGTVDSSFGNRGRVTTDFAGNRDEVVDVLVQSDGKVVVAGHTGAPTGGGGGDLALARYNLDGSLDPTFGTAGRAVIDLTPATGSAETVGLGLAPGGKFVVVARVFDPTGGARTLAVRLNPNGSFDSTYDGDGVASMRFNGGPAPAMTMGVGPDGKVTVAGITNFDPNPTGASGSMVVTRLATDGSPDTSFSGDGAEVYHDPDPTMTDYPRDITFVGGAATISYGTQGGDISKFDVGVVRIRNDGSLDPTFGDDGHRRIVLPELEVAAGLFPLPDGKLLVGIGAEGGHHVARLTAAGDLDTTFGGGDGIGDIPHDRETFATFVDLVAQPSGRIVGLAWAFAAGFEQTRFGLAALTRQGLPDPTFNFDAAPSDPTGRFGWFADVAQLPGGKLLAVGNARTERAAPNPGEILLSRFNADGTHDTTFSDDGRLQIDLGDGNALTRLAPLNDGRFLAFGTVLARFHADGSLDTTFGGGDGIVTPAAQGDGLALQPDGKILTVEGGQVARYLPDGTLDTTFGTAGRVEFDYPIGSADWNEGGPYDGFVPLDVAWQASSGKIVLGGQTPGFGTITDWAAVRIHPDGRLDTTFADGLGMITTGDDINLGGRIDVAPDGRIAMAGEEEDEDPAVILFDNDGNWVRREHLPWIGDTSDVSFTPDGRIVVVGYAEHMDLDTDLDHNDLHVIRLNENLLIDTTFGGPQGVRTDVFGSSNDFPNAVIVTPDGGVVVAGSANRSPVLVKYDGGGLAAPAVGRTFFGSTAWSESFRRALDRGYGDDRFGFAVAAPADATTPSPTGEPQLPLPWINLDSVSVQFNRPVGVQQGDLRVRGVTVAEYGVRDFRYDEATRTATWTLDQPIGADKLLLRLDGVDEVGAFRSRVDVLPGDVTGDRRVLAGDYAEVKKRFFTSPEEPMASGQSPYSVLHDVDGSGVILARDYAEVKKRFFTELPAGQPTGESGADADGVTQGFFSEQIVLA